MAVTSARPAAASSSGAPAYFDINNLFAVDVMHGSNFQVPRHLSIAADSIDAAMGDSMQQALRSIQVGVSRSRQAGGCESASRQAGYVWGRVG